ncbi:MAG: DUF5939 domain-containing protein [Deltaproteobacteria bacterium]|nr:DUF5939 domain-containing protein [Deltaproteobacteria bacterium]
MTTPLQTRLGVLRDQGVSQTICDRLGELIEQGPPEILAKAVPPRLAAGWGTDPEETLEAFLHATRVGLFDLEWDLRCPSCTGPVQNTTHLRELRSKASCDLCQIDFEGGFDDAVEVTFRVHPDLRDLSGLDLVQVVLAHIEPSPVLQLQAGAGGRAEGEVELKEGNYHWIVPGQMAAVGMRVDAAAPAGEAVIRLRSDGHLIDRGAWLRAPGTYRVVLEARPEADDEILLTRASDAPWISAAEIACRQSFRDLFSSELIRADQTFSVKNLAFVFTDIKGSTELYERLGDARAFELVREHFDIIIELVKRHRGAIVKTIGDAVMATFQSSEDALRFIFEMHTDFDRFNEAEAVRDDIIVKVGLHRGPCIAVNLNDRIDYFGRSVNTAARVQGLSVGGDIVISARTVEDPRVEALLGDGGWGREAFEAELKGIEGKVPLLRLARAGS